jgi:hypothetical protein
VTGKAQTSGTGREVIGLFADRDNFEAAIAALMEAGFDRADLSVLSSHESIDAAGKPGKPWRDVMTAMVGEIKYEVPLVASGGIFLAGGPVAATIAGIIGAAVGGVAIKEVLEEVTAKPHTEDFARSLEAGSVILWVRAADSDREAAAADILESNGGYNIHVNERPAET